MNLQINTFERTRLERGFHIFLLGVLQVQKIKIMKSQNYTLSKIGTYQKSYHIITPRTKIILTVKQLSPERKD